jgi:hypothetical protein
LAALRAIIAADGVTLLGQGLLCRQGLLVPLHVLDPAAAAQGILLSAAGPAPRRFVRLVPALVVPQADAALYVGPGLGGDGPAALHAATATATAGAAVQIPMLWPDGSCGTALRRITTMVRERVSIGHYTLRCAGGEAVKLQGLLGIVVDACFPVGSSGAPVLCRHSLALLGFVHGNIRVSGRLGGLVLDPAPLLRRLAAVSHRPPTAVTSAVKDGRQCARATTGIERF